ncbi:nucleoid-associated protein [Rhizobium leguminosarum]|uniref:nucleoid-associated protein n=1 Tax=Rhizobium TaxID=379 RepID=UPI00103000FE|nr:nucleoid-associated protein [Rhizobium leguminosarum]TBF81936.1 nucleoid-associated protein [Rhizobium leguminosarum]TBH01426.1 nucleoid-associated protein [Rhizobium leguminosarum]TBH10963.1 nucleoid-associated protein [Rhizobium leguminosarum]TBH35706.1 nucleoid-associated protein [Rhizobium leguminosarum]TBH66161.1 nucleoid-associated protein [Rhizobium leguminosarum]
MVDNVVQVAVHDLRRKGQGDFETILGKAQLNVSPTVVRVVNELHSLYASKASKAHGRFSEKVADYPAQSFISDFEKGNYQDFADLTQKLMDTLTVQARRKPGATGGHVLFAHIEKDNHVYLMVAIINDKLGAALTNDLDIADVKHLDLDGFRFAGRVNITAWLADADRYIGFLKGKGDVAEYFKEFLGCDTTVQDIQDTKTLIRVLENFADPAKGAVKDKNVFLQRAYEICERHVREGLPLDFQAFSNELYPEEPDVLAKALGDPDLALGDGFVPNRRSLRALVRFKAKTSQWSVEFDRSALAEGKIVYDHEKKTITFKELPAELVEELERERE